MARNLVIMHALLALPTLTACRTDGNPGKGGLDADTGIDADGDGHAGADDCDDSDPEVNAGAEEVCDGVDNDCDGEIDEDVASTWYADADGDGYGDASAPTEACEQPDGTVDNADDCDDATADASPDGVEVCDGIDNNCDGETDEELLGTWYTDADGDGYGDPESPVEACEQPDGTVDNVDDCDDSTASANPEGMEVCDDIDNDCDGLTDEEAMDASTFYADVDGDGFGDPDSTLQACSAPTTYVLEARDCDDDDFDVNPDATEICDGVDNDCDTAVDDDDPDVDLSTGSTWYTDGDTDGFGDAGSPVQACEQPTGTVTDDTDCDDGEGDINPDATEICDGVDNDCDIAVDDDDPDVDLSTGSTWYTDGDGDGYGDAASPVDACDQPSDTVTDDTDCDDGDADINPGETEIWYDGVDSDCAEDDDDDADGDGEAPYDLGGTDCDDTDATVSEAAGNCRASCTPPSPSTLASSDPPGVSDLQFDEDCNAWVTTLISGTDYVYMIDSTGSTTIYPGASNHNIGSVALDPSSSSFAVSYNNVGYLGVSSGTSIPVAATGGFAAGSNFANGYLRQSASSMAWDTDGCIWVPNFDISGSVDCFSTSGSYTTLTYFSSYVESVALDESENLYASVGATVYAIDSTGSTSAYVTVSDPVLDMAFDITGELYVLTKANDIILVAAGGGSSSLYATVSSEGKLAISPDGTLFHLDSQPTSAATYASWAL